MALPSETPQLIPAVPPAAEPPGQAAPGAPLHEQCIESTVLVEGRFLHLRQDTVRLPDGSLTQREYLRHPGAVMVLALSEDGQVVLERQFRYPMGRVMIELPAGKLDPGESPLACAQRELQEETGLRARQWAYAGATHNAIAYSNEIIHLYFARGLVSGPQQLDLGELLEVFTAPAQTLLAWVRDGSVTDAKTQFGCLWLQNWLAGQWELQWQDTAAAAGPASER